MGKIFYQTLNFPQNKLVLVSYFGYNCVMMYLIFRQSITYELRDFPDKI